MLLNVTGAAELNWPETVLICVREELWHLVFQSNPGSESGACDCLRGSAQFDFFLLTQPLDAAHWPSVSIHA